MDKNIKSKYPEMAKRLKRLRENNFLDRKQLAAMPSIGKSIYKYESGYTMPSIAKLQALADLYGVTTGYILNGNLSDRTDSYDNLIAQLPQEAKDVIDTIIFVYTSKE